MANITDTTFSFAKKAGYLFYLVNPKEHIFENVHEVPDYYKEITPVIMFMIVLEQFILFLKGKPTFRINDSVTSICQGMLVELFKIPLRGAELVAYAWVYNNYRIYTLPWDSTITWCICLIGTDFCFYWMHRAVHQISCLWLFHEVHHSSEDFNLMSSIRLSVFQTTAFWIMYVPLALAAPPSIFLVHYQLNIVYQYWLHTEIIPRLGAIEWVFVTPTHHKIHHGRNRRCIDKNFGGFLIIWDRIFGTFEGGETESIVYGLVHPLQTFSPITLQTNYLQNIMKRWMQVKGLKNKIFLLIKGPGWSPGTPWCGNMDDIPESPNEEKYDPYLPTWKNAYVVTHLLCIGLCYLQLIFHLTDLPLVAVVAHVCFIVFSFIAFGLLLDGSESLPAVEMSRSLLYFVVDVMTSDGCLNHYFLPQLFLGFMRCIFFISIACWILSFFSIRKSNRN